MALTVTTVDFQSEDVWGRHRVRTVDVTFDASYPTGGETLTPASCALAEIVGVTVIGNPGGYTVNYDQVTGNLEVRGQEPTSATAGVIEASEETAATDLSALTVRLLVIGH